MDEQSDLFEEFKRENLKLLEEIQSAIDSKEKIIMEEPWNNPAIWEYIVLPNLRKLIDPHINTNSIRLVGLAEFQLGLAKYFDYYSLEWAPNNKSNINNLVAEIVRLAFEILKKLKANFQLLIPCRKNHEDYACRKWKYHLPYYGVCKKNDWTNLKLEEAANFSNKPKGITLPTNTCLRRVISCSGTPHGHWWFIQSKFLYNSKRYDFNPKSKSHWRNKLAVRKIWNSDGHYVEFKVGSSELKVWAGEAANQKASSNCTLPGGDIQIWINTEDLNEYQDQLVIKPIIQWPIS